MRKGEEKEEKEKKEEIDGRRETRGDKRKE